MDDLTFAAAVDIAAAIQSKRVSSREVTQHYIERIESLDKSVNAMCVRVFEQALAAADQADQALLHLKSYLSATLSSD